MKKVKQRKFWKTNQEKGDIGIEKKKQLLSIKSEFI